MAQRQITIPEDVVLHVLSYLSLGSTQDRHTMSTLSLVSRDFLLPCRRVLFSSVVFDLSTEGSLTQCDILGQLFDRHPEYRSLVRRLVFTVPAPRAPAHAAVSQRNQRERRIHCLFGDQTHPSTLSSILGHWTNISTFSLSNSNRFTASESESLRLPALSPSLSWARFSSRVASQLARVLSLDTLQELSLVGVSDIPFDVLLRFGVGLRTLRLVRCTTGMLDERRRLDLQRRASAFRGHGQSTSRLENLVLDSLDPTHFELLVRDFWTINWSRGEQDDYVDLCCPRHLEIQHTSPILSSARLLHVDSDSDNDTDSDEDEDDSSTPGPAESRIDSARSRHRLTEIQRLILKRAMPTLEALTIDTRDIIHQLELVLVSRRALADGAGRAPSLTNDDTDRVSRGLGRSLRYIHPRLFFHTMTAAGSRVPDPNSVWPSPSPETETETETECLCLSTLTLKVGFWLVKLGDARTVNGEMEWALRLLRGISAMAMNSDSDSEARTLTLTLRTVEVRIHVRGQTALDVALSLSALKRYAGWRLWDEVLSGSGSNSASASSSASASGSGSEHVHVHVRGSDGLGDALDAFVIVIVVSCEDQAAQMDVRSLIVEGQGHGHSNSNSSGPGQRASMAKLEDVILDKFGGAFRRSGKLSVRVCVEA